MSKNLPIFYDCDRCPSYCCSYPRIPVKKRDLVRLARHFEVSVAEAKRRFTRPGEESGERVLRHQPDETYGTVCGFLDLSSRRCTIYDARPEICRDYPGTVRCGYYDFLSFERRAQEDPDFVPIPFNRP
ncbi:MAG TPA: YkgJ family cysteine cluster protein [Thermoanaerobaculia bacterium]|nr:YkgJ family cysteine cluster protein [Thermoanaerobaculia bacterium]